MATFKVSIANNALLTLTNVGDKKQKLGPFVRYGCGCSECGAADTLPIRKYDDVLEVLYDVRQTEAAIKDGDAFVYSGRTWRAEGPHVIPLEKAS